MASLEQFFPEQGKRDSLTESSTKKGTAKASNVVPHGNFGPILARSVSSLGELCTKREQKKFANRKFCTTFIPFIML
jgi:hypothetical protein